jgi:hypothetical protein
VKHAHRGALPFFFLTFARAIIGEAASSNNG